jgi:hypothetical protein
MPQNTVVQMFVDVLLITAAVTKVKVVNLPVNMPAVTHNSMRVACNTASKHHSPVACTQ